MSFDEIKEKIIGYLIDPENSEREAIQLFQESKNEYPQLFHDEELQETARERSKNFLNILEGKNKSLENNSVNMIPSENINELTFSINFAGYSGAGIKNTDEMKSIDVDFLDTSYTVRVNVTLKETHLTVRNIQIKNGELDDQERFLSLGNESIHRFELINRQYPNLDFTIKGIKYSIGQCLSIDELTIQNGEKELHFKPQEELPHYTVEAYNIYDQRCKQTLALKMTGGKRRGKKTRKTKKSKKSKKTRKH